jgi:UDP-N-acetylmuramoyl-L-alanyl-D-glutamate--2,6-diaminopimelate ligase
MTETPRGAMGLSELVGSLDGATVRGELERTINGITHDSRAVGRGFAFVALAGTQNDGHDFVGAAIAGGASAVIADFRRAEQLDVPKNVTLIAVPDTRAALARLAATFYRNPSRAFAHTVGVTGTNGKTTTTYFIRAILDAAGYPCGLIGTLGAQFGDETRELRNTTPLALELQERLAEMRDRGARAVVMEVSSHALALERVAGIDFSLAVLTNVTRDHLDFHGSRSAYAAAKRKLLDASPVVVLNADDPTGASWVAELRTLGKRVVTYGIDADADVRAVDVKTSIGGSAFAVGGSRFSVRLPGAFNVANALAAIAAARMLDVDDAVTARALESVGSVPGRMEHFAGAGVDVFVDYAHTPDALASLLDTGRKIARARLITVFGCGGDRDRGKRPEMGRIATERSDLTIVTSDNPRREDPQTIVQEILGGVANPRSVIVELDRAEAIRRGIEWADGGDVVVIAGKGHENYQVVGTATLHFDDREIVRSLLAERAERGR